MLRSVARRGTVAAVAGLVVLAGQAALPAQADAPDPYADAGAVVGWPGSEDVSNADVAPASLADTPVTAVAAGRGFSLALTAEGKVVCFGDGTGGQAAPCNVPEGLTDATSITAGAYGGAGAVTKDGKAVVWGWKSGSGPDTPSPDPWQVPAPADLREAGAVKDLALGMDSGAAVRTDGSVEAWGQDYSGQATVPEALQQPGAAAKIVGSSLNFIVLKPDGSVTAFGSPDIGINDVPASLQEPGAAKQVFASSYGAYALTSDDELVAWGNDNDFTPATIPAALDGKQVRVFGSQWGSSVAVTTDDQIVQWNCRVGFVNGECPELPAALKAADVTAVTSGDQHDIAVVRAVIAVAKPTVAGNATVGSTLTGTPGTFSGGGTVTQQWLADGTPIEGATSDTFTLTAVQKGAKISLRSTATKGDVTESQTSGETAAVTVAPATISSATATVTTVPRTNAGGTATLSFKASGGAPVDGTAKVALVRGATKKYVDATVTDGKGTATLPKLTAGTWRLKATLQASDTVKAASTPSYFLAVKAPVTSANASLSTVPTSTTKGRVVASFKASGAAANGLAVATFTKGSTVKHVKITVANGRGGATAPTLAKGTWTYKVTYRGSSTVFSKSTRTYTVRITR